MSARNQRAHLLRKLERSVSLLNRERRTEARRTCGGAPGDLWSENPGHTTAAKLPSTNKPQRAIHAADPARRCCSLGTLTPCC